MPIACPAQPKNCSDTSHIVITRSLRVFGTTLQDGLHVTTNNFSFCRLYVLQISYVSSVLLAVTIPCVSYVLFQCRSTVVIHRQSRARAFIECCPCRLCPCCLCFCANLLPNFSQATPPPLAPR